MGNERKEKQKTKQNKTAIFNVDRAMYEVKLHTKCSRHLKSRSLRDQRILVLRYLVT